MKILVFNGTIDEIIKQIKALKIKFSNKTISEILGGER